MTKNVKSAVLLLFQTVAVLTVAIIGFSCPLSCKMDDGIVHIVKNDYETPVMGEVNVTSARTVSITFSKKVEAIMAYVAQSESSDIMKAECSTSGEMLNITCADDLTVGVQYSLGGKVRDGGGNTLRFCVPILGYNDNPAGVVISAVHPKYAKDGETYRDEFVQLYVTRGGNLSGFTLRTGKMSAASSLVLPAVEVRRGEIVTVHLQQVGIGCVDEMEGDIGAATSRYSSTHVRDIWAYCIGGGTQGSMEGILVKNTATNCLGENDDVILLCHGNEVLDAVLYAVEGSDEWSGTYSAELAEMAVDALLWQSAAPDGGVILDKAMTTAWILKRTGCALLDESGNMQSGRDWVKTSFAKKIEQKVLSSIDVDGDAGESSGGGVASSGDESDGVGGTAGDSAVGGTSGSGTAGGGGGTSTGGASGSGSAARRPSVHLPPPACIGNPPRVIISSVHPAYTSSTNKSTGEKEYKVEFIQLYALQDGNLSHLTVCTGKLGSANKYPLPSAEVKSGDIITVHLRHCDTGEAYRANEECDEVGEGRGELCVATSRYSSDAVRDVWIDNVYNTKSKKGAAALDRLQDAVAVYCGADYRIMDCVIYCAADASDTTVWKSLAVQDIVNEAVAHGLWGSASPQDCIVVDKHFTPATILRRNGCEKLLAQVRKGDLIDGVIAQDSNNWSKQSFSSTKGADIAMLESVE